MLPQPPHPPKILQPPLRRRIAQRRPRTPEGRAGDDPAATSPATWSWMGGLDITKKNKKKWVMGWRLIFMDGLMMDALFKKKLPFFRINITQNRWMGWVWSLDFSYFVGEDGGFRFFETLLGGWCWSKKIGWFFKKGVDEDSGFVRSIDLSWCWNHPSNINIDLLWLVVNLPLWKIWVRQLGLWHSQFMESHKIPWFQTTNQWLLTIIKHH